MRSSRHAPSLRSHPQGLLSSSLRLDHTDAQSRAQENLQRARIPSSSSERSIPTSNRLAIGSKSAVARRHSNGSFISEPRRNSVSDDFYQIGQRPGDLNHNATEGNSFVRGRHGLTDEDDSSTPSVHNSSAQSLQYHQHEARQQSTIDPQRRDKRRMEKERKVNVDQDFEDNDLDFLDDPEGEVLGVNEDPASVSSFGKSEGNRRFKSADILGSEIEEESRIDGGTPARGRHRTHAIRLGRGVSVTNPQASHLVEEVAMRLKQAEIRVFEAENQSQALEEEALALRRMISDLQQARILDAEKRNNEESLLQEKLDKALADLDARQRELETVRQANEAAQARVQELQKEETEKERKLTHECSNFEEQVRAERSKFAKLKAEAEELEALAQQEKKVATQKLADAHTQLETETERAREASAALQKASAERERLHQALDALRDQKRDLSDLVAAARRAETESKAALQEAENRVKAAELSQQDADEQRKHLEVQLAQSARVLEDSRAEREQLMRQLERIRTENGDLERELERLGENKINHSQQTESLRRQLEDAKDEARRSAERARTTETRMRQEQHFSISKLEHENQLLRHEVERLQASLQQTQNANTATQSSARAARLEVERIAQALQRGQIASTSLAQELQEKQRVQAQVQSLQREVETLRASKESVIQRAQQFKRELQRKADDVHRLSRIAEELQSQLRFTEQEKEEISRRHRQNLQAKDAENTYVWHKLEQALRM